MRAINWLIKILFFLLIFTIPLLMDVNIASTFSLPKVTLLRIISLLILGLWIIKLSFWNFGFVRTGLFYPIIAYVITLILSLIFSRSPVLSFFGSYERQEGVITLINYIFLFFAAANLLEKEDIKLIIKGAILAGFLSSLYGIFQHYNYDPFGFSWGAFSKDRVVSTFGNPVFFGAYTVMVLPLAFSMFILEKTLLLTILYGASFFTILGGFLFANTRACYVGLFLEIIVGAIALFILRKNIPKKRLLIVLGISLIFVVIVSIKLGEVGIARFSEVFKIFEKKYVGSTGARLMMWKTGIEMIKDNPIFGIGPETIGITYPHYLYQVYDRRFPFEYEDRMHNDIFDTSVTRGIPGLLAYLWIIFSFYVFSIRLFFKVVYQEKIIVLGLSLGVLGYLAQNQFSFGLPCISLLFWIMLGSIFLLTKQKQRPKPIKKYNLLFFLIPIFLLFIPIYLSYEADRAIRNNDYQRAIRLNPFCRDYRETYGSYLVDMGKNYGGEWPDRIISEMTKANKVFKNDGILLSILGMGYEMKGNIDKALSVYEKALWINPYLGNTFNNLGAIYGNKGMFKEAGEAFLRGLKGFPHDSMLFSNAKRLGFIMLDRGMEKEAEEIFDRLTELYLNKEGLIELHRDLFVRYSNEKNKTMSDKHLMIYQKLVLR
ncbi:TPA: hypothetical protein DCX16_06905 [bacterium]|nr:hypothetical protein [bacterium]